MLESIKKVDKKIIIMFGVMIAIVLVIIIALIVLSLSGGGTLSFEKIETKLVSAAESYYDDNEDKLPAKIGESKEIKVDTLVKEGYISALSEYTEEGVKCDAKVIVAKIENGYDYVAALDCGKEYKTVFLADYLKEKVVTSGSGLYQVTPPTTDLGTDADGYNLSSNELLSGYVYRGEKVNNYIQVGNVVYRIVRIDGNNDFTVVTTNNSSKGVYDDRHNNNTQGINDYTKSRVQEALAEKYTGLKIDGFIKSKSVTKDVCIGARSTTDTTKDGSTECKVVMKDQNCSLLPVYEILNASLSDECQKTTDAACRNYNYLMSTGTFWTMTPTDKNTYSAYISGGKMSSMETYEDYAYKYVYYLSSRLVYESGTGTEADPFIVK